MISRKEIEDRIVALLREQFLKYSDETLEKYGEKIKALVRWYVSTLPRHVAKAEADDLEQEAKIAFLDCIKTWDPRKGELWTYVSVRLKGSMQDYLRKRGNDPVVGMYEFITSAANVYMAFNSKHIAQEDVDKELHFDTALKDLSQKEKTVIDNYYRKDMTFKEIGKEIGLSESQVSRICKDATLKLKETMAEAKEEPSV
ncbi:hypothetical protein A3K48_01360 [candidate division WOR-1 bacterium RIFOXYA12_FULL_52_29]|uniref:RNA polymerase sigma-70 region 4 domain-containing protein n=1 Tax=candidate division WOR-1 bacterium RIFOXYC12_FULL_54_18 TaxID=1802584 RepID=A0A1F4T4G7_UNCSA|nr:MAG: hypothetical protein A3K44_01360 [candidate division WOR-1 bacterium RIFOXYA2_FULL_51_19]OGC17235.1 MAG: hypothetical protein A3K48_01360 [candidate division WOR-1 bacterium RIFOXYA12_FULL_52_29]OGC26095.1 MAG: hypothetical protein A3K32_01355 [candidate division WOR-1 bacterium RIFOXYB2_FULL_45_9]OGC27652.1 MAG: hypothetical protein A3K49_01360 [candidate division WOR-1 bacterium RIFOXYC12_FULL_54_18]OGC29134.1 MAG: hypothetical protein A2346_00345 [candidate division WOR-1 bacterium R